MLTDTAVRTLRPQAKEYKKSDAGGLYLLVKPTGAKLWRLAYRYDEKQKTLIGGTYSFVGLAAAREWRDQAHDGVEQAARAGRLRTLERMGLAEDVGQGRYRLDPELEPRLRELGRRGDIAATLNHALRGRGVASADQHVYELRIAGVHRATAGRDCHARQPLPRRDVAP